MTGCEEPGAGPEQTPLPFVAVVMGTVGHKHNYAILASTGLTSFVQIYWASDIDFPCLSSFVQRAKLPQQLLDGACIPAGAACSSALPGWVSPAGSICPASLQATQVMTAHLQSQPGYGAVCYSVQKASCMLCLGSHQLLKDLLQKAAPPHKTETVTLRAGGQSCSPQTSLLCIMGHLCLTGAFMEVEELKGALFLFHWHVGNTFHTITAHLSC